MRQPSVSLRDKLVAGEPAPQFSADELSGSWITLEDFAGKRLWLTFFHTLGCPLCLLRAHEMIKRYPQWAVEDFVMVAVFHSDRELVAASLPRGTDKPPFPMICDPGHQLYRAYGFRRATLLDMLHPVHMVKATGAQLKGYKGMRTDPRAGTSMSGDMLINEDGRIAVSHYCRYWGDHVPFQTVEHWLGFKLLG